MVNFFSSHSLTFSSYLFLSFFFGPLHSSQLVYCLTLWLTCTPPFTPPKGKEKNGEHVDEISYVVVPILSSLIRIKENLFKYVHKQFCLHLAYQIKSWPTKGMLYKDRYINSIQVFWWTFSRKKVDGKMAPANLTIKRRLCREKITTRTCIPSNYLSLCTAFASQLVLVCFVTIV